MSVFDPSKVKESYRHPSKFMGFHLMEDETIVYFRDDDVNSPTFVTDEEFRTYIKEMEKEINEQKQSE